MISAIYEAMEPGEFVTRFRRKAQGLVWIGTHKVSVTDLVRITELERDTNKQSESKRPKELRVVWIRKEPTPPS
jgi:hypothetical protein